MPSFKYLDRPQSYQNTKEKWFIALCLACVKKQPKIVISEDTPYNADVCSKCFSTSNYASGHFVVLNLCVFQLVSNRV